MAGENLAQFVGKPRPDIQVDLSDWQKVGGFSGFAPFGNYEMETVLVTVGEKSDGSGLLDVYEDRIVGPASAGVSILTRHPALHGSPDSKQFKDAKSWLGTRMDAYFSHMGKDPADFKKTVNIKEGWVNGKRFYATLRPGQGQYADRSEIAQYLSKAQYEAAPGPREQPATGTNGTNGKTNGKASALDTTEPTTKQATKKAAPQADALDL